MFTLAKVSEIFLGQSWETFARVLFQDPRWSMGEGRQT